MAAAWRKVTLRGMSPLLRPVGPLPAAVYWVRRLALVIPVVLLCWLAVAWMLPDSPRADEGDRTAGTAKDGRSAGSGAGSPEASTSPLPSIPPPTGPASTPAGTAGANASPGTTVPGTTSSPGTTVSPGATSSPDAVGVSPAATQRQESRRPAPCATDRLSVTVAPAATSVPAADPLEMAVEVRTTGVEPCRLAIGPSSVRVHVTSGSDLIWDTAHCPAVVSRSTLTLAPGKPHGLSVTWPGVRSREGCPSGQPEARAGYYGVEATVGGASSTRVRFQLT